jgi:Cysteine-rich secretory protein family
VAPGVGIESRDWYRESHRHKTTRGGRIRVLLPLLAVVGLLLAVSPPVRDRLGYELPFGLESAFQRDVTPGALRFQPLPGMPSIALQDQPLYPTDDPWRPWLADEQTCPRGEDRSAPPGVQRRVLLCLVNFARRQEDLSPLRISPVLHAAAAAKAADIGRCGTFEHAACGEPFDDEARTRGYRRGIGENLYVAEGPLGIPRVALDSWLNSEGHRENLFRPEWRTIGIGRLSGVDVAIKNGERVRDGVLWVNLFGD